MAHRRFFSAVGSGLLVLLAASTAYAAGPFAYLAHHWANQVSVVDTSTGAVVTLTVGSLPVGIAATPHRVYVTNSGSNDVSVIDTATNTVVPGTIPVGNTPFGIAAEPSGQRVWVANQGDKTLSVIDTATNAVTGLVPLGGTPVGIAVHPAGTSVFVTTLEGSLIKINAVNLLQEVPAKWIGNWMQGIAVSPDGTRAWVAYDQGALKGGVAVVDTETLNHTTVDVPMFPKGVAVDPQGNQVYVGDANASVTVIDAKNSTKLATVGGLGWALAGLSAHPAAPEVWVADEGDSNVFIIETVGNTLKGTVSLHDTTSSFGNFITAPAAAGCDDALQAAVEEALAKVEAVMRQAFQSDFTVPGDTSIARVRRLGRAVSGLTRGHLTGLYHNLLRVRASGDDTEPQICDEDLEAAVEQVLANVERALRGIDRSFRLPGSSTSRRLHHLADAVAGLELGRLQGLYWTLR